MPRRKLQKFAQYDNWPHCFDQESKTAGTWHNDVFKNNNPITLELGCGYGDYTLAMAREYPDQNFIGIDVKGNRLWRCAKTALDENLTNVAFLRIRLEFIHDFFELGEVNAAWIPFSDPFPKKASRRLISANMLHFYRRIFTPDTHLYFKTDDKPFYAFALGTIKHQGLTILEEADNLHEAEHENRWANLQTEYEKVWREEGRPIHFIHFLIGSNPVGPITEIEDPIAPSIGVKNPIKPHKKPFPRLAT